MSADLKTRLDTAYMQATGRPSGQGSQTWIADLIGVGRPHVNDMVHGREAADSLERALDLIEVGRRIGREQAIEELREKLSA